MNTDNMSILGLTVDYGPYGWLEPFDPDWTPNTTDFSQRRYSFGQQPRVGLWNLMMLARALTPLVRDDDALNAGLERYRSAFGDVYHRMLWTKLGLTSAAPESAHETDFIDALHQGLTDSAVDMTLFFRHLSHCAAALHSDSGNPANLFQDLIASTSYAAAADGRHDRLLAWLGQYRDRLRREPASAAEITESMLGANPKYVLRNYLAQKAIEGAERDDLSFLNRLMTVLKTPFDEQPEHDELAVKRPDWARDKPGSATLSCSS
jgi:uncharacterized protein YdiU (UPF0061 family)